MTAGPLWPPETMDFEEIKLILAMVREHDLAEFELEHQGFKIRIRKDGGHPIVVTAPVAAAPVAPAVAAQAPDARPFVEVGDAVKKGQVLCIIEAMKLMNEIDSEYEGEVVKVYVDNGQAVQFDERLFAIRAK